jgi:signal transduction histidine kinase
MRGAPRRGIARLVPAGLRWRLAGWIALVTLVCTAIAFAAVYGGTGSELRGEIDGEVRGDASELAHNIVASHARTPAQLSAAATRYIREQPFSPTSTLLFVSVAGSGTSTNRPELFGAPRPDNGESVAQQVQEDGRAAGLLTARDGFSTLQLPDVGALRLLKRTLRLAGGLHATIGVGEPLETVAHAQRGVARAFILAGVLALVGALFAAYLIGARVTRPLRRMAAVAARVAGGDLRPRIHDVGGDGDEVEVLAETFNRMLDRLTDAFAAQRAFVADASHELRTPLTVIAGQLEVLAAQRNPSAEEIRRVERLVQAEIARVSRLVDDLLLLAQTEQAQSLRIEPIELQAFVTELWEGMRHVAHRRFELGPLPSGTLHADPDRLAQALRNLIRNAIEHTAPERGLVRMRVERAPGARVRFLIEDDGPGIEPDERERIFDRFHRVDAARDRASGGAGLGLAIVRAIADAHRGAAHAGSSPEGGARMELELPGFSAAPAGTNGTSREPAEPLARTR